MSVLELASEMVLARMRGSSQGLVTVLDSEMEKLDRPLELHREE